MTVTPNVTRFLKHLLGVAGAFGLSVASSLWAQTTVYWDTNAATAGSSAGTTADGTWDTSALWNTDSTGGGGGTISAWVNGNNAVFSAGSNATGTSVITVAGTQSVSSITIEDGTVNFTGGTITFSDSTPDFIVNTGRTSTVSSVFAGSNGLAKSGAGTLITGGALANTQTGALNVNAGVYEIAKTAAVSAIADTSAVAVASGATLRFNGTGAYTAETIGALSGAGTVDNASANALALTVGSGNGSSTFSGTITDTGGNLSLIKTGSGTLVLSGVNTYAGATSVVGGILRITADNNLGSAPGSATPGHFSIGGGATLQTGGMTLDANRGITLLTNGDSSFSPDSGTSLTYGGIITGGSGVTMNMSGAGTFYVSGNNTYEAATNIASGTMVISHANALGATTAGTTVQSGAGLGLQGGITFASESLTLNGGLLRSLSGNNTWTGTIALAANSTIQSDSTLTVNNVVSGAGNLNKNGTGTLILSGTAANTNSGTTTVSGGTLVLNKTAGVNALGSTAITVNTNGTLRLDQHNQIADAASITVNSAGQFDVNGLTETVGSLAGAGNIALGTGAQLTIGANNTNTNFSGVISESGTSYLFKTGTGTQTFSGTAANTFTGQTEIREGTVVLNKTAGTTALAADTILIGTNGGIGAGGKSATLRLAADNQIVDTASIWVFADTTLDLTNRQETLNEVFGYAGSTIALGATGSLTVGANDGFSYLAGTVSGTGTLTQTGADELRLGADLTFAGMLVLDNSTLNLNNFDLSLDTLRITGNSVIDFAAGGAGSQLSVANLIFDVGATLSILNWIDGSDYFFAQNWAGATKEVRGSAPMNQITFASWSNNDTKWQNNDNQITPVPEPSTYGAILIGSAAVFTFWCRNRRKRMLLPEKA